MSRTMSIERAIDVFVHGYCFLRSMTHPYVPERIGPLWVMRDLPGRTGVFRTEEYVAHGVPPQEVDQIARHHTRGRYCACALQTGDGAIAPLRDGFKNLGYRLNHSELLMQHSLNRIPRIAAPVPIERVTTLAQADALAKAARRRQILPQHLGQNAPQRTYVALAEGKPIGWVNSIVVGDATWCANMFVLPAHRRRGIARALLSRMLRDDRKFGATHCVLLASHAGAKLYPLLGFRTLGTLLVFSPRK